MCDLLNTVEIITIRINLLGLGNISRQYSFYLPMHTQPDLHTKTKKDSQHDHNTQEGGSDTISDEKIEETKASVRPEYAGDKGDYPVVFTRNTPIEKKPVATFSYGERVRIAGLYQHYESMIDHIVQVAGWARTTRMGGKDFAFIELTDGSCGQTL